MTPALAVISELQERGYNNFIWVGHKFNQVGAKSPSAEYQTVTKLNIPFIDLKAGKLSRNWGGGEWGAAIVNLVKIPWGFMHSLWIILSHRPDIILSFGGYLALPIAIMGKLMGKKVLTHEQTAVTGLTNKIIPYFADKIAISWPSSQKYYPAHKTILTGNPLRPEVFDVHEVDWQVNEGLPTIYITGGNQGSHKLNVAVFEILGQLLEKFNVIHQTGNATVTGDFDKAGRLAQEHRQKPGKYLYREFFFSKDIGTVFHKANLVIARSGANTVYEILALAKPAIFIPIPWVTHNEQYINAQVAQEAGLATILEEKQLSGVNLLTKIREMQSRTDQKLTPVNSPVILDASKRITDIIESLISAS